MFKFSKRSLERLDGVDDRMIEVMERALTLSTVDFGIAEYGGLRTPEEQHELYLEGSSTLDGYLKKSYHQTGKAVDVYAYVEGKASWEERDMAMVAAAVLQAASALGYKVEWGGFWTDPVDMPHFQMVG